MIVVDLVMFYLLPQDIQKSRLIFHRYHEQLVQDCTILYKNVFKENIKMKLITIKITHVDQCDFEHKMSIQKASCQSKSGQKMSDDVFFLNLL